MSKTGRRLVVVMIGVCCMFVVACVLLAQSYLHPSLPDPVIELKGDSARFPMTLVDSRPVVQVRINGQGPFPFILDSGAEGTILSQELAASLKLPVLGHARAGSPGALSPQEASLVRFDKVEIGDLSLSQMAAVAVDLTPMAIVFSGPGAPVGAISFRNWKGLLVTLDYPGSRIEVRRGNLGKADDKEVFEFDAGDKVPSVPISVGNMSLRATIDSGASRAIVMPRDFESKLSLLAPPVPAESLHTVGAVSKATAGTLKGSIKLGRYSIDNPEIHFVDNFPIVNFGYPILQRFAVTLDWQNHTVRLTEPPAKT